MVQDPNHWERVLVQLCLRPEQLQQIGALHHDYMAVVDDMAAKRRQATDQLQQARVWS